MLDQHGAGWTTLLSVLLCHIIACLFPIWEKVPALSCFQASASVHDWFFGLDCVTVYRYMYLNVQ